MARWLVIVALASAGCGKDSTGDPEPRTPAEPPRAPIAALAGQAFGIESARITFKYTGEEEGTVTAWFAGHGTTVALFADMTKPTVQKRHTVWEDGETAVWDEGGKPTTTKVRAKQTELRLVSTLDPRQLETAGYAKRADEPIAGQDCEVWISEKTNVALFRWQGIDLKYANGMGKDVVYQIVEATEVATPTTIPPEMLTPPAN